MNILIVTAHPSSKSHTRRIAETYAEAKRAKGHFVEMVDLYAKEYATNLLTFENLRDRPIDKIQKKFQEQLLWAHELVVVHPVWWGTPPAIMKNWVELTFWPGISHRYTPTGKLVRLLGEKSAKIFATSGGPGWINKLLFMPLASFWRVSVLGFSGIDITDMRICGNLDKWRGEKADKYFEKFLEKLKRDASK